jgi:alkanesulfonate monooxygenase SsuD/methylene tetrahydromethanopterin reductase-like flavin-dependent oxidoreductase (luciferase family)
MNAHTSPQAISQRDRMAMHNANRLKIGLFGANCSSGRAVTAVPERWPAGWADNLRLARMADDAGVDFLLPIGRWKGYGGDTDYQGATLETVTWATGLLGATKRITVFGTVHAPLFHPLIAAKQFVTADHVGQGRFGLNIVVGWNEDEFEMFGVQQRDHEARYRYGQEWIDAVRAAWSDREDFDLDGEFIRLRKVRAKPKPFGGSRPLIMNAGASPTGRSFALRNCDAFFTQAAKDLPEVTAQTVRSVKDEARQYGREIDVYTVGVVTCRPTRQEAEDYYRHCIAEHADWSAVDAILAKRKLTASALGAEEFRRQRLHTANGMGGLPLIGTPDQVATQLAALSRAGLRGIGVSFVNYLDELPYFAAEVLPRLTAMGVRA